MNPFRDGSFRETPNRNTDKAENWNILDNLANGSKSSLPISADTGHTVEYLPPVETDITQKQDGGGVFSFRNGQPKFASNHIHESYDCVQQNQQGDEASNAIVDRPAVYGELQYAQKIDTNITGHNFVPQIGDRISMHPTVEEDETGGEDEEEDENDEDYVETPNEVLRSAKATDKSPPAQLVASPMLAKPMSGRVPNVRDSTNDPSYPVVPRTANSSMDRQSQVLSRSHYLPPHHSLSNQQRYNVEPNTQTPQYFTPEMGTTTEISPQFAHVMGKSHGIPPEGSAQSEPYNEVGDLPAHQSIYSHVTHDSGMHIAERLTLMDEGDDSSSSRMSFRVGKLPKRKTKKYNPRMSVPMPANSKNLRDREQSHSPSSVLNDDRMHHATLDHWVAARSNINTFPNSALRESPAGHYADVQEQPQISGHRLPQYMYETGAVQKSLPTHGDTKIVHHQRHMINNESAGAYPEYETFPSWHEQPPSRFYEPVAAAAQPQRLQGGYESGGIPMDPHYHYVYPYSHGVFSQPPVENYFQPASRHEDQQAQAELNIVGNLRHMSRGWNEREIKAGRRLVAFQRVQKGVRVDLHFKAIDPKDYNSDICAISCILRKNSDEFYVTSVDCIALLELIIDQKFSVEEKNRIRRNLEVCRPITVSKSKPGLEDFFRQIMTFGSPRPRNIEKDVKVMLWENLENALQKIVAKYSASWSAND